MLTLADLPVPLQDKHGWPWTVDFQTTKLETSIPKYTSDIKVSVITPSYNQGEFIEETIRSVLLQGYSNLEYIIIDGGSSDATLTILEKYRSFLAYAISEPDRGQSHAINKGLEKANGQILAYLNSDDCYLPGTLQAVAKAWQQNPDADLIHGRCRYINSTDEKLGEQFASITQFEEIIDLWDVWWKKRQFVQPEVFWTRRAFEKVGLFREDLNYAMDYDYWCRILQAGGKVQSLDQELACFRLTPTQKSSASDAVAKELLDLAQATLWNPEIMISPKVRSKLQGNWIFNVLWQQTCTESLKAGNTSALRWFKLMSLTFQYPQLLHSPLFLSRVQHWIKSRLVFER